MTCSKSLTLEATGTVPVYLSDFNFEQVSTLGGLIYTFNCYVNYALMGTKTIDHRQTFKKPYLQVYDPEMTVIVIDANHPQGQVIKIDKIPDLGGKAQGNGATAAEKPQVLSGNDDTGALIPKLSVPEPIEITVWYGETFTINRPLSGSRIIKEQHNDSSLLLKTAYYEGSNVYWTYDPLQTGTTEVILTATHQSGVDPIEYATKFFYIIKVQPPLGFLPVTSPNEILSFKGRVNIAQRRVEEKYNDVVLITVNAKTAAPYPAYEPLQLPLMHCLFGVANGLVSITSTGRDTFGPPVFEAGVPIVFPTFKIEDCMDINEAADDMRKYGIEGPFWSCDLAKPWGSGGEGIDPLGQPEAFYCFVMADNTYTYVGAKDGSVRTSPALLKALPGVNGQTKAKVQNGA